jgi:hypothetical protein
MTISCMFVFYSFIEKLLLLGDISNRGATPLTIFTGKINRIVRSILFRYVPCSVLILDNFVLIPTVRFRTNKIFNSKLI